MYNDIIFAFTYGLARFYYVGLSVVVMFCILIALYEMILRR